MNYRELARRYLDELDEGYLEVCKVPSRDGGYIRICMSVNAEWYRAFCKRNMIGRKRYPKPRTIIKRCHTIAALRRIVTGNAGGVYGERLIEVIHERIAERSMNNVSQPSPVSRETRTVRRAQTRRTGDTST